MFTVLEGSRGGDGCEVRVSSRVLLAPLHTRGWESDTAETRRKVSAWGILVAHKAILARKFLQGESYKAVLANQGRLLVSICMFVNRGLRKAFDAHLQFCCSQG